MDSRRARIIPPHETMSPVLPVGEEAWVGFIEEAIRRAHNNEGRAHIIEIFHQATHSEPGSLRVWLTYCEYFWTLYTSCISGPLPGWTRQDQIEGIHVFSLNDALSLWNKGYNAIKYRIGDSHALWDRWISLELEQLARTRTPEGVVRITHLFRNRLQTPHQTWDRTSSMFSTFLSEYSKATWEQQMADVTRISQDAKKLYMPRDHFELKLTQAQKSASPDAVRTAMKEYLGWEIAHCRKDINQQSMSVDICLGLFGRALAGIFSADENIWNDYLIFLSTLQAESKYPTEPTVSQLEAAQRAVTHCSWSGPLWARYMLNGEEAGLDFTEMEKIKHSATTSELGHDGMSGVVEMYAAWCGYLKRTAMDPLASDEAVELAAVGLPAAIEDVQAWGHRLYRKDYQGDPNFRLERLYIQYLTEKEEDVDAARKVWKGLANRDLYANSYSFWLHYYMWEMLIYSAGTHRRSPTPPGPSSRQISRLPTMATQVLQDAVTRSTIDWPERVMEVYIQHCNDYERPSNLRTAIDLVHRIQKRVVKRREAEMQAQQVQQAQQFERIDQDVQDTDTPTAGGKRKREENSTAAAEADSVSKRLRTDSSEPTPASEPSHPPLYDQQDDDKAGQQPPKRDREHTSVLVTGLPADVTQTQVKRAFADFGNIKNLGLKVETDAMSSVALIEFRSVQEAESALMRKYFDRTPIEVVPATDLTLFVTNFPPHADDKFMRQLFGDCGEILSIRWPSLKYNTHRRFCYVSFRDSAASAKATGMDGKLLEGRFKLEAKYSNPANKKAREGAIAEGREIHVSSVDNSASELELRDIFSKYGTIESVKLLRNQQGKSRGSGFVVLQTKEEAEAAVAALDKTKFGRSILSVEMSVRKNYKPVAKSTRARSGTPTSQGGDHAEGDAGRQEGHQQHEASFALMGLPDTVNDARVRSLLEKYGEVVKLVLRPDRGAAMVEFVDAASAGRATLGLEGFKIEGGHGLRTRPVKEFFRTDEKLRMAPSSMVRRPVMGGMKGNNKPKRGIGFVPMAAKKDKEQDGEGRTGSKSNADFKDMFLNSQKNASE